MEQSTKHVNNAKGDATVTAIKQSKKKKGDDSHKGTKKTNASREGVRQQDARIFSGRFEFADEATFANSEQGRTPRAID